MGHTSVENIDCTLIDPEKLYKTPESVLADSHLTREQKDKILHCWEQDQLALIRAEEENMPQKENAPLPSEVLEKIMKMENKLEAEKKEGKTV